MDSDKSEHTESGSGSANGSESPPVKGPSPEQSLSNDKFRMAMSETIHHKMNDKLNTLVRSSSESEDHTHSGHHGHKRPSTISKRASWHETTNTDPGSPRGGAKTSPRGPMKGTPPVKMESPTSDRGDSEITDITLDEDLEVGGIPEPQKQLTIISSIDVECTCTYAISKLWYKKWEEHVGAPRGSTPGETSPPGSIEMDLHNDANNEYVNEEAWKCFVRWYTISPTHQLDRKHLYFKDEKLFDICTLSPFSGIVEHQVKKFNRFEEIGYIECQLRKVFGVQDYKRTRLWISEKAQVPRFRQLLLRFRMLNDCIHRDKMYILALEECLGNNTWPTGEPGEPKGDLSKYEDIVFGPKPADYWSTETVSSLDKLTNSLTETIRKSAQTFMENGQMFLKEKEDVLEKTRKAFEVKLESNKAKEGFLNERSKEVALQDEKYNEQKQQLDKDRQEFEEKEKKFKEELEHMENMHQIQDTKIKLDIGGQIYTTSINTLRRDPDSMLAAMFSGRHELKKEADGSFFIDRDGTFFRHILNFLRDGIVDATTLPNDYGKLKEILREAKYYQLGQLVEYLDDMISGNHSNGTTAVSQV